MARNTQSFCNLEVSHPEIHSESAPYSLYFLIPRPLTPELHVLASLAQCELKLQATCGVMWGHVGSCGVMCPTTPQPHSPTTPQPHSPTAPQPHSPTRATPQQHPSGSPAAPQQHPSSTPAAPQQHPSSTPAIAIALKFWVVRFRRRLGVYQP